MEGQTEETTKNVSNEASRALSLRRRRAASIHLPSDGDPSSPSCRPACRRPAAWPRQSGDLLPGRNLAHRGEKGAWGSAHSTAEPASGTDGPGLHLPGLYHILSSSLSVSARATRPCVKCSRDITEPRVWHPSAGRRGILRIARPTPPHPRSSTYPGRADASRLG